MRGLSSGLSPWNKPTSQGSLVTPLPPHTNALRSITCLRTHGVHMYDFINLLATSGYFVNLMGMAFVMFCGGAWGAYVLAELDDWFEEQSMETEYVCEHPDGLIPVEEPVLKPLIWSFQITTKDEAGWETIKPLEELWDIFDVPEPVAWNQGNEVLA